MSGCRLAGNRPVIGVPVVADRLTWAAVEALPTQREFRGRFGLAGDVREIVRFLAFENRGRNVSTDETVQTPDVGVEFAGSLLWKPVVEVGHIHALAFRDGSRGSPRCGQ